MLTTVAAGRVYDYSYCIGMYSQSAQGFWTPQDFVFGKNGRIYVLSRGVEQLGQRVSKINFDHEFQGQFGSFGGEDGRFMWTVHRPRPGRPCLRVRRIPKPDFGLRRRGRIPVPLWAVRQR